MSLKVELQQLIHPERKGRYDGAGGEKYQDELKVWRAYVPVVFFASIYNIMKADSERKPIQREDLIKLAVATNQVTRNTWSFIGSHFGSLNRISYVDLAKGADICAKYKFKGLVKANDDTWVGRVSKLQQKINSALAKGVVGEVHCRICGRQLTNRHSVRRGIGPICWRKRRGLL